MRYAYPLMLDVRDRLVVIIGAGAVAVRKCKGILESGGRRIRVVAPAFHADIPQDVERVQAGYAPEHLNGAALAFALTDQPAVNDAVVRDARRLGVLVCRADSDETTPGDFTTPARLAAGDIAITVSAGSAALSAWVRDRLGERIDPAWVEMASVMKSLRPSILRDDELTPAERAEVFRTLASQEAIDVLRRSGRGGLIDWLRDRFPA